MPVAERLSARLQRLAVQQLRAVQVALVLQDLVSRISSQTISPEERQFELMRGRKLEGGWR